MRESEVNSVANFVVHGYSPLSCDELAARFVRDGHLAEAPGDFVCVIQGQDTHGIECTRLASSAVAAQPYFYGFHEGRLIHGPSVLEVDRQIGAAWSWNPEAVNALFVFDHLLEDQTLHAAVRRVPQAAVVGVRNGELSIERHGGTFSSTARQRADFDEAFAALRDSFAEIAAAADGKLSLSLSAGYDSRLLLALCLANSCQPVVGTMGSRESTDMRIAGQIAAAEGLDHRRVEIDPDDYRRYAAEIVQLTNGTKSVGHWHTYIYSVKAGLPTDGVHLAGANGEIARSYFLDKGALSQAVAWTDRWMLGRFLALKFGVARRLGRGDIRSFFLPCPDSTAAQAIARAVRATDGARGLLNRMDHFYVNQRVRHFIGNGLALYRSCYSTASPFLDHRFNRAASRLPRRWKLCSRFHREAIRRLAPRLLTYPTGDDGPPMGDQDVPFYWLKKQHVTGYNPLGRLWEGDWVKQIVHDSPHLDQFMSREVRERVWRERRGFYLGHLVSLHFYGEAIEGGAV